MLCFFFWQGTVEAEREAFELLPDDIMTVFWQGTVEPESEAFELLPDDVMFFFCRELLKLRERHLNCYLMMKDSVTTVKPPVSYLELHVHALQVKYFQNMILVWVKRHI